MNQTKGTVRPHGQEALVANRGNDIHYGRALLLVDVGPNQREFGILVFEPHPEEGRDPTLVIAYQQRDVRVGPGKCGHLRGSEGPVVHEADFVAEFPEIQASIVGRGGEEFGATEPEVRDGFALTHFENLTNRRGLVGLLAENHDLALIRHRREYGASIALPAIPEAQGPVAGIHLDQRLHPDLAGDVFELVGFVPRLEPQVNEARAAIGGSRHQEISGGVAGRGSKRRTVERFRRFCLVESSGLEIGDGEDALGENAVELALVLVGAQHESAPKLRRLGQKRKAGGYGGPEERPRLS